MITAEQLRALKKGNVSVDADKSRTRIPDAFKGATKRQKDEIIALTGLAVNTFYGVARSGAASPRVVLSLSQILDISPYYLTGEIDERKHCDAADLAAFFTKCGGNLKLKKAAPEQVSEAAAGFGNAPMPVIADTAVIVPVAAKPAPSQAANSPANPPANLIDEESLILLIKALTVRARYGGEAERTYNQVVGLLVK